MTDQNNTAFAAGLLAKLAAKGNPAAPAKSATGDTTVDHGPPAAYLNQGGGKAAKQTAGPIESRPQPHPGHVNIGDKGAGTQVAGDVGGRGGAPDTGDLGMGKGGDMAVTKSAAWIAGEEIVAEAMFAEKLASVIDDLDDDDVAALEAMDEDERDAVLAELMAEG